MSSTSRYQSLGKGQAKILLWKKPPHVNPESCQNQSQDCFKCIPLISEQPISRFSALFFFWPVYPGVIFCTYCVYFHEEAVFWCERICQMHRCSDKHSSYPKGAFCQQEVSYSNTFNPFGFSIKRFFVLETLKFSANTSTWITTEHLISLLSRVT